MTQRNNRTAALSAAANAMQNGQARSLDALAEYAEFRDMFLPAIRAALLREGATAEKVLAEFKPLVAARLVQIGLTGSENAALGAIKEMLDRQDGKPAAKVDVTHRMAKLSDAELDALLASQTQALATLEGQVLSVTDAEEEEKE